MGKKKQKKPTVAVVQPSQHVDIGISKRGWKIIISGIIGLVIGFILLTFTNPEGNNWASIVSPIVIISSYVIIAVGILAKG